jgi:hypothetical protein
MAKAEVLQQMVRAFVGGLLTWRTAVGIGAGILAVVLLAVVSFLRPGPATGLGHLQAVAPAHLATAMVVFWIGFWIAVR